MRGASEQQIVADYSSTQVKIPAEFWAELKEREIPFNECIMMYGPDPADAVNRMMPLRGTSVARRSEHDLGRGSICAIK